MPGLAEIHARDYPDMPIEEFARRVHSKSYSDMPFDEFARRAGLQAQSVAYTDAMADLSAKTRDPRQAAYDAEVERRAKVLAGEGAIATGAGALARGATLGLGDRVGAALAAPVNAAITAATGGSFDPIDEYRLARDASFRARDIQRERDPATAVAGELIGSAVSGVGLSRAAPTVFGAGTGGLASQVGRGAAQGAGMGAVYGGGQADEGEVVAGAVQGGLVGGAVGGALPVAGKVLSTGAAVADTALSPYLRPRAFAAKKVAQRLDADGLTPQTVAARMARAPGSSLADVAGENTRGLLRTAVNVPGAGRQTIQTRLNVRQMGANQRATEAIDGALGDPAKFESTVEAIATRQRTVAGPLYQKAFASKAPVNVGPVLAQIDKTIAPGLSRVATPKSGIGMDSVSGQLASIRSKLASATSRKIDLQQLHLLKMDIDGTIGTAKRAGNDVLAAKLTQVKSALLRQMDVASPLYAKARQTFAGEAELRDALEAGREFVAGRSGVTVRDIASMTPAQKEMARLGAARALKESIDSAVDGADLARRLIGSKAKRDALKVLIDDASDRKAFLQAMIREARFARTRTAALGNSTTTRQQADMEDAGIGVEAIGAAVQGNLFDAIKALVARSGARIGGVTPRVAKEIADLTTTRDPNATAGILSEVARSEQRSSRMEGAYRTGLGVATAAAAPLSSLGAEK